MPQNQRLLSAEIRLGDEQTFLPQEGSETYRSIFVDDLVVSCPVCETPNPRGSIPFSLGKREHKDGALVFYRTATDLAAGKSFTDFTVSWNSHRVLPVCPGCGVVFAITESVIRELQELAKKQISERLQELLALTRRARAE